jgi:hypothetical protein
MALFDREKWIEKYQEDSTRAKSGRSAEQLI